MHSRTDARRWAPLVLLTAVAAVLRLIGAHRDLWLDEIVSLVRYFRLPPFETLSTYASPNQHLLYSFAASWSVQAFGEQPWTVRVPALLFGIAGPAAVYVFAKTVGGDRREALWAAALTTVSYHHVWFSQDARGYTAMIFWTALGTAAMVRALRGGGPRPWLLYVTSMVLGIGFHLNTAFVALGNAAGAIVGSRWEPGDGGVGRAGSGGKERFARITISLVAIVAGSLLLYAAVLDDMLRFFAEQDRAGFGSGVTTGTEFAGLFREGVARGFGGVGVAALAATLLLTSGAYVTWRRQPTVFCMVIAGPVIGLAAVVLLRYGAFPRAFLYVVPAAMLFFVRGCDALGTSIATFIAPWRLGTAEERARGARRVSGLLLAAIVAASSAALPYNYRYPKQDYTGALAWTRQQAEPGDVIAAAGTAGFAYAEYYDPSVLNLETSEDIDRRLAAGTAMWVLFSLPRDMRLRFPELFDAIERRGEGVAEFPGTVDDGTMYVVRIED